MATFDQERAAQAQLQQDAITLASCSGDLRIALGLDPVGRRRADREVRERLRLATEDLIAAETDAARMRKLVAVWKHHAEDAANVIDGYARQFAGARHDADQLRAQVEQLQTENGYWRECAREWHREAIMRRTETRDAERALKTHMGSAAGRRRQWGPFVLSHVTPCDTMLTTVRLSVTAFGRAAKLFETTL